jgi:gamma-glutamyltranspeptidase/glutathione hydrolase
MRRILSPPPLTLLLLVAAGIPGWAAHPVRARHGMVVTVEPHATAVGVKVLESGGNAVDAAVAVGFALAVTHPGAGNLGGGGFMLLRMADGRTAFVDFRERAPLGAWRNMYVDAAGKATRDGTVGYRASGVPGTVRGMEYASRKFGGKSWAELVGPAVELASKGYALTDAEATAMRSASRGLSAFPESNRVFLRGGKYYEPGDTFVQPDLGRTLERIARLGARDFYEGETARLLAADMKEHGGLITLEDLKGYQAIERKPTAGKYRGYDILSAPPPSSGGVGILQMLGVLEGTGFEKAGAGSATAIHYMTEAMRHFFADRSENLGDPDFVKVPLTAMLDPRYIGKIRAAIDAERATPSSQLKGTVFSAHESEQTTHYTIADAMGNVVAVTYTLNDGFGSKVTATGLGFLLNDEMDDFAAQPGVANGGGRVLGEADAIAPRKTPLSSMTPTIVLRDGKPFLALGSPGGQTIINTVLEVMVNAIDWNMNVQDAVNWPRFHHAWLPDELQMEPGYSPDTIALLQKRGYTVKTVRAQGECAAIRWSDGWLEGAADPRSGGTAEGY